MYQVRGVFAGAWLPIGPGWPQLWIMSGISRICLVFRTYVRYAGHRKEFL